MVSAEAVLNPVVTTANGGVGRTEVILGDSTGFVSGQLLLLHQTQGTDAGHFELHRIDSVDSGVATVSPPLTEAFGTGAGSVAQAIVVPQYASLTVTSGGRVVAPAWDGTRGGIVAIAATGEVTIETGGSIDVSALGFRGGVSSDGGFSNAPGTQGEGQMGLGTQASTANGNGGGGGLYGAGCNRSPGGGGGAGGEPGGEGLGVCTAPTMGGVSAGGDASPMLGGGGGTGGPYHRSQGGRGGGIIIIFAESLVVEGTIAAGGSGGAPAQSFFTTCGGGGGGGGGGSIFVDVETATLGDALVTAAGGPPGPPLGTSYCAGLTAGAGGAGRISVRAAALEGATDPPAITP
jgi:hypothetical protein